MWTVTMAAVHDDWVAGQRFSRFLNHLQKAFKEWKWGGVRVTEIHPGGHGLHWHLLVDIRLPVDIVRRVGACYGIGRVQVARVKQAKGVNYLAKYLSKRGPRAFGPRGGPGRRWASFGAVKKTRVKDVEWESPCKTHRQGKGYGYLSWDAELRLRQAWKYGAATFDRCYRLEQTGRNCMLVVQGQVRVDDDDPWGAMVRKPDWPTWMAAAHDPF